MRARDEIIARILTREGDVADVGDGKGITRYGQTPGWLSQFNFRAPTNATEAAENYAEWMRITKLDQIIADQPDALADSVIDLAVHSGHVLAIMALQRAVHVTADGVIGPVTIGAVAIDEDRRRAAIGVIAWRMEQQGAIIARDWQLAKQGKLKGRDENAKNALGWARRNAEHIRGLA